MNPKKTLLLAGEYFGVLEALAYRGHGVSLSSLYDTLRIVIPDHPRSAMEVTTLLSANGLLAPSPEADGEWEIPPAVTDFILHLAKRQRLLAPGELRGLLLDMESEIADFGRLTLTQNVNLLRQCALRLINSIQRAQRFSSEHHGAVVSEVTRIKIREDNRSLRERYEFIKLLYERHALPMQDLVDVDGMLVRLLDRLLGLISQAEPLIDVGGGPTPISRLRAHVLQLKREARDLFHESFNEVLPLYNALRQDHELAAAAATMLEVAARKGLDAWDIGTHLAAPSFRAENLFNDYGIEDYLHGVQAHSAEEPTPLISLATAGIERSPDLLHLEDVIERLKENAPVPDILAWLFQGYSEQPESELLCAFVDIAADESLSTSHADAETESVFRGVTYTYYPLGIELATAA